MPWRDRLKNTKRNVRYFFLKGLVELIRAQPPENLSRLKNLLLKLMPLFFSREMKRARELLPQEFASKADEIICGMAESQISNILEIILYEKLLEKFPRFIEIQGLNVLDDAIGMGQGFIILSAHFGNWELIAYTLVKMGYDLHVIARPQALNRMTEFMNGFRRDRGVHVLMDNNLSTSLKLLKQGKAVGLVSDLNARERGYRVKFFGRDASFYPTPVILSMRSGAPLIPTFIERKKRFRQIIRFEPPISWVPGETMAQRVRKYVECFERAFRSRPDHWVWFHERYAHAHLGRTD